MTKNDSRWPRKHIKQLQHTWNEHKMTLNWQKETQWIKNYWVVILVFSQSVHDNITERSLLSGVTLLSSGTTSWKHVVQWLKKKKSKLVTTRTMQDHEVLCGLFQKNEILLARHLYWRNIVNSEVWCLQRLRAVFPLPVIVQHVWMASGAHCTFPADGLQIWPLIYLATD